MKGIAINLHYPLLQCLGKTQHPIFYRFTMIYIHFLLDFSQPTSAETSAAPRTDMTSARLRHIMLKFQAIGRWPDVENWVGLWISSPQKTTVIFKHSNGTWTRIEDVFSIEKGAYSIAIFVYQRLVSHFCLSTFLCLPTYEKSAEPLG